MAAALALTAMAQTGSVDAQIDIPFEFSIGKTVYQPAAYTVSLRTSGSQMLTLSQNGRHLMAMQVLSRPSNGIRPISASSFLVFDVALFQPFGLYTNRWLEIGGGSNWWYHPIWWMLGTYLPWLGAWILACQAARGGQPSLVGGLGVVLAATVVCMAVGVVLHVPGAGWNVGTYGVAFIPGFAIATAFSVIGARRK